MDEKQKSSAINILEAISKHPVVRILLEGNINNNINDIRNNVFSSIEEWDSHFLGIINEICKGDQYCILCHDTIERIYKKEKMKQLANISYYYWYELISYYRERIGKGMISGPERYLGLMKKITKRFSEKETLESKKDDTVHIDDLNAFTEAVKKLEEDSYHEKMIEIIEKNETNLSNTSRTDLVVDLTSLKKSTVKELIGFVKRSLSEKGIKYLLQ